MDRKTLSIILVCVALLMSWNWFVGKLYPPLPAPVRTNQIAGATNQASTESNQVSSTNLSAGATKFVVDAQVPEELLVLSNKDARYTFTSRGGGIKEIELLGYPETVSVIRSRNKDTNEVVSLNATDAPPVLAIVGDSSIQGDGVYKLTPLGTNGVRAEKSLSNGLVIIKDFHITNDYLITTDVRLTNQGSTPVTLPAQEWVVGTSKPLDATDTGFYLGAMWFDGSGQNITPVSYFSTNTTFLGMFSRTVKTEYRGGASNVVWASAHNQFFAIMAMPKQHAQEVLMRPVVLPPFPNVKVKPGAGPPVGVETSLIYPGQTIGPGQSVERQVTLFAGPKEYRMLARIAVEFKNEADLVMNFGTGFVGFWGLGPFFAKILLTFMYWLQSATHLGYGLVIVVLTILLRAVFWPFTAAAIRSGRKMQALAPQMNAIKEKYKEDPQKQQQKIWEFYKQNKVNPFGGCLPSLVQMPVFFGFLAMIRCAVELRGAHFLWAGDLSKPDTLTVIPGVTFIPFFSTPDGLPLNLLPLFMVGVMVWQAHLQPPSPGMDPSQQKMMRYMPLMFLVFLYNYSSGMALYMTVSTLASAIQSIVMKRQHPIPPAGPALTPPPKKKK